MPPGFIFSPGIWIGEGKITLNTSPECIKFYTKWEITQISQTIFDAIQIVEMQGVKEKVINHFTFKDITSTSFSVFLESEEMGKIEGIGMMSPTHFSWKICPSFSSEGFEKYELLKNGDYRLHAEYSSADGYQTLVDGIIWKKTF